jgi:hypothetical protein
MMSELQTAVRLFNHEDEPQFKRLALARRSVVALDRLPDGFEFPAGLRDRIKYDDERRQIAFHGYMSSSDYLFLRACSDDLDYIRAINELHERSAIEIHCRQRIIPTWLWVLVAASFALTAFVWLGWFFGPR